MNWVGGSRSRIKLQNEKKLQKDFFERKRFLAKHQRSSNQPSRHQRGRQSQDLLALRAVTKAYSTLAHDQVSEDHRPRAVRKLDLAKFNSSERIVDEIEMPLSLSPGSIPSTLAINDVHHESSLFKKNSQMLQLNKPKNSESVFTPIQHSLSKEIPRKQTSLAPGRHPFDNVPGIRNRVNQQFNMSSKVNQKPLVRHPFPRLRTINEEPRLGLRATKNFNMDPFEEFKTTPMKQYYWSPYETPALPFPEEDNQIVPYSLEDTALPFSASKLKTTKPSSFFRNNAEFKVQKDVNEIQIKQESILSTPINAPKYFNDHSHINKSSTSMYNRFQVTPESHSLNIEQQSVKLSKPVPMSAKQLCPRNLFPDSVSGADNYSLSGHIGKNKLYDLITPTNSIVWSTPTKRRKINLPQKSESAVSGTNCNSYGRISPLKESPSLFFRHRYISTSKEATPACKIASLSTTECGQKSAGMGDVDKENRNKKENEINQEIQSNNYRASLDKNSSLISPVTDQQPNSLPNVYGVFNHDQRTDVSLKSPDSCVSEPGTTDFWKRRVPSSSCNTKATPSGTTTSRVFQSEMSFLQTFDTLRSLSPHMERLPKQENTEDMDEILSELNQLETQQSWESSCPISETKGRNLSEEMIVCSLESQKSLEQLIEERCDAEESMIAASQGTEESYETAIGAGSVHSQELQPSYQSDKTATLEELKSYISSNTGVSNTTTEDLCATRFGNEYNGAHTYKFVENVINVPYGENESHVSRENHVSNASYGNNESHLLVENVPNASYGSHSSQVSGENVSNAANVSHSSQVLGENVPNASYGGNTYSSFGNTVRTEYWSGAKIDIETKSKAKCVMTASRQTQTNTVAHQDTSTSACIDYCDMSTQWDPADLSGPVPTSLSYDRPPDFYNNPVLDVLPPLPHTQTHLASDSDTTSNLKTTAAVENFSTTKRSTKFTSPCTARFPTSRKLDFSETSSISHLVINGGRPESVEQSRDCRIALERVPQTNYNMAQGTNKSAPEVMMEEHMSANYSLRSRHRKI